MKVGNYIAILCSSLLVLACTSNNPGEDRGGLLLTHAGVEFIQDHVDHLIIEDALEKVSSGLDQVSVEEIDVPVPADPGGGYTHEKHKENYALAQRAGLHYQLTGDSHSLSIVRSLLLEYAELYPTLGLHPKQKNQGPGKLFWQILNEEVALVHFIQAYASVKSALTPEDRQAIEEGLFMPMVGFIKDDSRRTFTRIHNHAMWGAAAVGMSGIVLEQEDWVEDALYGVERDQSSGYFAMLDALFSPDGYYSEGPYYQRYALMPLVVFAQALEMHKPEYEVFAYRDGIILKSIQTTFDLSTCKGDFFPINDAIKSKNTQTPELGYALPLMFAYDGQDAKWMDAIVENGNVVLTDALIGLPATGSAYERTSRFIKDGPQGEVGGLGILRTAADCSGVTGVLKFGTHGMGHGHFDQLGLQVFAHGEPFLVDYGASRFLNVPQKEGGRYLPENNTWANQTVAHNSVVINERTQYGGSDKRADAGSSHVLYTQFDQDVNAVAGWDSSAYPGVHIQRHLSTIKAEGRALILDVIQVKAKDAVKLDVPTYYEAQLVETRPGIVRNATQLKPLGNEAGYEYLWNLGSAEANGESSLTWLKGSSFYTLHQRAAQGYDLQSVHTGANDASNNLVHTEGMMLRFAPAKEHLVVQLLEAHGNYDPVLERTDGAYSKLNGLEVSKKGTEVEVRFEIEGVGYKVELATEEVQGEQRGITITKEE